MELELTAGDITAQDVDAIVNAANSGLLGGGGVDGAIHAAGGPDILRECRELRASTLPDGLPTGQAVATTAGRLPARWVVHTVGPVYASEPDAAALLASAYRESLRVAAGLGARSVAFPSISTGAFGYPLDEAAPIALRAVHDSEVPLVRFVLFSERALAAFVTAARALDVRATIVEGRAEGARRPTE